MNYIHQVNDNILLELRLRKDGGPLSGQTPTVEVINPLNTSYYYDWSSDTFVTAGGLKKKPLTESVPDPGLYTTQFNHALVSSYANLKMIYEVTGVYTGRIDEWHTFLNINDIAVRRTVAYDPTTSALKVIAWLERNNIIVPTPTLGTLTVYKNDGTQLFTPLTNNTPAANNTFVFDKTGVTLEADKSYLVNVAIQKDAVTYETMTSFLTIGKHS